MVQTMMDTSLLVKYTTLSTDAVLALHHERNRQIEKGYRQHRPIGDYVSVLRREIREAEDSWVRCTDTDADDPGRRHTLAEITQVGAVALACLENYIEPFYSILEDRIVYVENHKWTGVVFDGKAQQPREAAFLLVFKHMFQENGLRGWSIDSPPMSPLSMGLTITLHHALTMEIGDVVLSYGGEGHGYWMNLATDLCNIVALSLICLTDAAKLSTIRQSGEYRSTSLWEGCHQ